MPENDGGSYDIRRETRSIHIFSTFDKLYENDAMKNLLFTFWLYAILNILFNETFKPYLKLFKHFAVA